MSLRFHEIAESRHRILNPITDEKLHLLGEICRITPGARHLDLACGKGEMLTRWAARYGSYGVGVDISNVFLTAARERADELDVTDQVRFIEADAGSYEDDAHSYDIVSCMGATWIGGGLAGTLTLIRRLLRPGGLALVGDCYWISPPSPIACASLQVPEDSFASLSGTAKLIEDAGYELVEMVLANHDTWDRYVAAQWWTLSEWLRENPDDPDAPALQEFLDHARGSYLEYGRRYMGWGAFVLRG